MTYTTFLAVVGAFALTSALFKLVDRIDGEGRR